MATTTQTQYQHLEPRPGSFYRELFLRGLNLRASRLVSWMQLEGFTPQEAAADRGIPVEAVLEAVDFVTAHGDVIADDLAREHKLMQDRGLLEAGDA